MVGFLTVTCNYTAESTDIQPLQTLNISMTVTPGFSKGNKCKITSLAHTIRQNQLKTRLFPSCQHLHIVLHSGIYHLDVGHLVCFSTLCTFPHFYQKK